MKLPKKIFKRHGAADIYILGMLTLIMAAGVIMAGVIQNKPSLTKEQLARLTPPPASQEMRDSGEPDIEVDVPEEDVTTPQITSSISPTPSTTPPLTPSEKIADLIVVDLRLTDENGREKTTFDPGERIYPKVTHQNQGTRGVESEADFIYSQIYDNQPSPAQVNQKSDVNIWLRNGRYGKGSIKTYAAYPGAENERFYQDAHYFVRYKPGKYTARAFINYDHGGIESDYDNNQKTITYTISNKPTPTPTKKITEPSGNTSGFGDPNVQPNSNTCGGKYNFNNPLGKNFGDPLCTFTKDKLFTALKQADPGAASYWFYTVIPCESPGYDANLFYRYSPAGGAWGLFQMDWGHRSDSPPGQGLNGVYDRGDVAWPKQVTNATTFRLKMRGGSWRYWECAKDRW